MPREDLSKLKELRALRRQLSPADWERMAKGIDVEVLRRLEHYDYGLTTQEEFAYILRLLLHASKIEPIDKAGWTDESSVPSDYQVLIHKRPRRHSESDRNTIRCLVEVKRGWQFKWRISRRDYDRRLRFAETKRLQLIFAVKFAGNASSFWGMFPAAYVLRRNLRLGVGDIMANVFDILTGNFQIHLPKSTIEYLYQKGTSGAVVHPRYGALRELYVRTKSNVPRTTGEPYWRWLLFAFSPSSGAETTSGTRTMVTKTYESQIVSAHHAIDALTCVVCGLNTDKERHSFRVDWLAG